MIWDEFLRHFRFCDEEDSGLSDEEQERKGPKNRPKHTRKRIHQAKKNFLEKFKTASKSLSFYGMFFKTLFHLLICFLPVVILLFSYIRLLIEGFSAKLHIAKRRKSGWYGINRWTLFRWKSSPPISPVFIVPFCPEMQVGDKRKTADND
ncbi:hypothetical protein H9625_05130 [Phocaeicola sp. Sa1CVN1]|uniref:Uncharacterized protein n=1 Tax=Phocaeicola intestinalis TaxID=2762212 RepID=A0ABR8Y6P8_9BACT|nr:hypothetical protein [Phocaeicola intestinalis]MBD8039837.1 hypothetical protein [Phocaeicola intestinalis]